MALSICRFRLRTISIFYHPLLPLVSSYRCGIGLRISKEDEKSVKFKHRMYKQAPARGISPPCCTYGIPLSCFVPEYDRPTVNSSGSDVRDSTLHSMPIFSAEVQTKRSEFTEKRATGQLTFSYTLSQRTKTWPCPSLIARSPDRSCHSRCQKTKRTYCSDVGFIRIISTWVIQFFLNDREHCAMLTGGRSDKINSAYRLTM